LGSERTSAVEAIDFINQSILLTNRQLPAVLCRTSLRASSQAPPVPPPSPPPLNELIIFRQRFLLFRHRMHFFATTDFLPSFSQ
jgi:hypothetical protein